MPDDLFLGVDIGTTAVKASVFDGSGAAHASASRRCETTRPRRGWAEQDPLDWWSRLVEAVTELGAAVDLGRVRSVGVCGQVNTHAFVDDRGEPLLPAIVWQDQRCAELAAGMDAGLSAADRQRLWGGPFTIDSSFSLVRLAWLAGAHPAARARVRWIVQPKDHVNWRLTGALATDFMSPVGLVGPDRAYLPGVLALVPGAAALQPPIRDFTAVLGTVGAHELPQLRGATVAVGTMDAWGSIYGSGLVDHGVAMDVCGTSEIVALASHRSTPTRGVISFPPIDGLTVHAGPTQAGGDALRWWAEGQRRTLDEVLSAAAEVLPCSGPIFHPYLAGERAPLWDGAARGMFFGVAAEHDFRHFSRAVLEGVAFSVRHLLEEVERAAATAAPEINASGGGARSGLWCQIKADVLGRDVRRLRVLDSGVLGAGLIGAVAAGAYADLRSAARATIDVERTFAPARGERAGYDASYAIYRDLYEAVKPSYGALAARRTDADSPS